MKFFGSRVGPALRVLQLRAKKSSSAPVAGRAASGNAATAGEKPGKRQQPLQGSRPSAHPSITHGQSVGCIEAAKVDASWVRIAAGGATEGRANGAPSSGWGRGGRWALTTCKSLDLMNRSARFWASRHGLYSLWCCALQYSTVVVWLPNGRRRR